MMPKQRSVDALERVYTFVIGLALVQGVTHLIDLFNMQISAGSTAPEGLAPYGMGVVMLVTLIPFYHGANRHIDDTYLFATPGEHAKPVALVIDVGVLVIEGLLFVFMGASVRRPEQFLAAYLLLLVLDIVWVPLVTFLSPKKLVAEWKWVWINMIFAAVIAAIVYTTWLREDKRVLFAVILAVLRSAVDYGLGWKFYAGQDSAPRAEPAV